METNFGFIYLTTNILNDKKYIGKRVYKHNKSDTTYLGSGKFLKNAIKKDGVENFKREILISCSSEEELNQKEIEFIQNNIDCLYPTGYNIATINCGGDVMKHHPYKIEINQKRIEKIKAFDRNSEWRKKIGDFFRGKSITEEHRQKIIKTKKEKLYTHSTEIRKKISSKLKGRKLNPSTVGKMSESRIGKPRSEETKLKISNTLKRKYEQNRSNDNR
jgi:hypothetical protein